MTRWIAPGKGILAMALPSGSALAIGIALCVAWTATAAWCETVVAVDGNTIRLGKIAYRLDGIDAPDTLQSCGQWSAGLMAASTLHALVAGRQVVCLPGLLDRDTRIDAGLAATLAANLAASPGVLCTANGEDLAAAMVSRGMAWAAIRARNGYASQEAKAKAAGLGVHGRDCQPAWEWRAQRRRSPID